MKPTTTAFSRETHNSYLEELPRRMAKDLIVNPQQAKHNYQLDLEAAVGRLAILKGLSTNQLKLIGNAIYNAYQLGRLNQREQDAPVPVQESDAPSAFKNVIFHPCQGSHPSSCKGCTTDESKHGKAVNS